MCKNKFLICEHCGNIVEMIHDVGVSVKCCGQKMQILEPGIEDAAREKHFPIVSVEGNKVKVNVGAAEHPMSDSHSILWVSLETDRGVQRKSLCRGRIQVETRCR